MGFLAEENESAPEQRIERETQASAAASGETQRSGKLSQQEQPTERPGTGQLQVANRLVHPLDRRMYVRLVTFDHIVSRRELVDQRVFVGFHTKIIRTEDAPSRQIYTLRASPPGVAARRPSSRRRRRATVIRSGSMPSSCRWKR